MADYAIGIQKQRPLVSGIVSSSVNRCRRFSQNAWKKDLCSNCFKSKEEHQKQDTALSSATRAAILPVEVSQSKPKRSILKGIKNDKNRCGKDGGTPATSSIVDEMSSKGSRPASTGKQNPNGGSGLLKVKFLVEESEVIGYGGDDEFYSDDDEESTAEDCNVDAQDDDVDDEDDINLQKLTKLNTDFNSVTANLTSEEEGANVASQKKNIRIPLQLGRLNVDNDGQKRTLLVSVKPFGADVEKTDNKPKIIKNQEIVGNSGNDAAVNKNKNSQVYSNVEETVKNNLNVYNHKTNNTNICADDTIISACDVKKVIIENDEMAQSERQCVDEMANEVRHAKDFDMESVKDKGAKIPENDNAHSRIKDSVNEPLIVDGLSNETNLAKENSLMRVTKQNSNLENCDDLLLKRTQSNVAGNDIGKVGTSSYNNNKDICAGGSDVESNTIGSMTSVCNSNNYSSVIENKKTTQITRGTILTKNHEPVIKTKRFQLPVIPNIFSNPKHLCMKTEPELNRASVIDDTIVVGEDGTKSVSSESSFPAVLLPATEIDKIKNDFKIDYGNGLKDFPLVSNKLKLDTSKENIKNTSVDIDFSSTEKKFIKSISSSDSNVPINKLINGNNKSINNLKLQQKNYKNTLSSDDNKVKGLSFKDYKSVGFDYCPAFDSGSYRMINKIETVKNVAPKKQNDRIADNIKSCLGKSEGDERIDEVYDYDEEGRMSPLTSRESAGEPDGKADSDDTNEPISSLPSPPIAVIVPARHSPPTPTGVPRSPPNVPPPPPPMTVGDSSIGIAESHNKYDQHQYPPPRTSFLHSLQSTKIQQRHPIQFHYPQDKPKPPAKPNNLGITANLSNGPNSSSNQSAAILTGHTSDSSDNIVLPSINLAKSELVDECQYSNTDIPLAGDNVVESASGRLHQNIMKRQAPKPPPSPVITSISSTSSSVAVAVDTNVLERASSNCIASENSARLSTSSDGEPPVVKARDRRNPLPNIAVGNIGNLNTMADAAPVLATRSASQDSLSFNSPPISYCPSSLSSSSGPVTKRGSKVRSTLRKLLRFGSRNDEDMNEESHQGSVLGGSTNFVNGGVNNTSTPTVRTRPEIIHPLDLNKSGVQVLCNTTNSEQIYGISRVEERGAAPPPPPLSPAISLARATPFTNQPPHYAFSCSGRPNKPPPPPRSQSLDLMSSSAGSPSYCGAVTRGPAPPARPPPPLNAATSNLKLQSVNVNVNNSAAAVELQSGLYANLGDARLEVAQDKSHRTGVGNTSKDYVGSSTNSCDNDANVYEYVRPGTAAALGSKQCFNPDLPTGVCSLSTIGAVTSTVLNGHVSYCGSETESDIGCNIGITDSNEVANDQIESDQWRLMDMNGNGNIKKRHRSIVHSSLEENYGAVIVANHEALSQLLEQANRCTPIPELVTGLKNGSINLCWTDFTLDNSVEKVAIGCRRFFAAHYNSSERMSPIPVSLCISTASLDDSRRLSSDKLPFCLQVVTEFNDFIPANLFSNDCNMKVNASGSTGSQDMIKVTVSVLVRQKIESFVHHCWPSLSADSLTAVDKLNAIKESGLVLYQLINCLMSLRDRSIQSLHKSDLILCKDFHANKDSSSTDNCNANKVTADEPNSSVMMRLCLLPHQQQCSHQNNAETQPSSLSFFSSCNDNSSKTSPPTMKCNCEVAGVHDRVPLHQCLLDSLCIMALPSHLSTLINKIVIEQHHSSSLSQAKALLELWLWGPPGDVIASPLAERHHVIQRWLDLERATVLQSLLLSCPLPLNLSTYDHCHLSFLVQTNAKIINDALKFFTDYQSCNLNSVTEC